MTDLLYLLFVFDFFIVFILCVVSVSVFLVLFVFDETSSQTWGGVGRSSYLYLNLFALRIFCLISEQFYWLFLLLLVLHKGLFGYIWTSV